MINDRLVELFGDGLTDIEKNSAVSRTRQDSLNMVRDESIRNLTAGGSIKVAMIDGQNYEVPYDPQQTIPKLRAAVCEVSGVMTSRAMLTFAGNELQVLAIFLFESF